jgi:FkbM family methyltransferase
MMSPADSPPKHAVTLLVFFLGLLLGSYISPPAAAPPCRAVAPPAPLGVAAAAPREGVDDGGAREPPPPPPNTLFFDFPPSVKRVFVNVGSNRDPNADGHLDEEDLALIAVEPILEVAAVIPRVHSRVFVIAAAISNVTGFANFHIYNGNGESSSLAAVPDKADAKYAFFAADDKRPANLPPAAFVPVLTLKMLLDAIPPHLRIVVLKTDMQGFDFTAVAAAGRTVLRAERVLAEVTCNDFTFNPRAPSNDLQRDWLPYMEELGFVNVLNECAGHPHESNAAWERRAIA